LDFRELSLIWHSHKLAEADIAAIKLERGVSRLIPILEGIDENKFVANPVNRTCQYCKFTVFVRALFSGVYL